MPLTDKEKRIITSPFSFTSKQRKSVKFRTKKKIQAILCDMQFLIENHSKISEIFGINILENDDSLKDSLKSVSESKTQNSDDKPSDDPDML